jgi:hypothetical protein
MLCCAPLPAVSSAIADGFAGCTDSPMDGPTIGFQHKAHGIVVKTSSKLLHNNCMVQFKFVFSFYFFICTKFILLQQLYAVQQQLLRMPIVFMSVAIVGAVETNVFTCCASSRELSYVHTN